MNDLWKILADKNDEMRDDKSSYWTVSYLYWDAKKKFDSAKTEEITDSVKEMASWIFFTFVCRNSDYLDEVAKANINPNLENLNSLTKNLEEILANIDKVNENFPNLFKRNINCEEVKKMVKVGKKLIKVARDFGLILSEVEGVDKEDYSWTKMKEFWQKIKQKGSIPSREWVFKQSCRSLWEAFAFWFYRNVLKICQRCKFRERFAS